MRLLRIVDNYIMVSVIKSILIAILNYFFK